MPRQNRIRRANGQVVVVIDSIEHRLTEPAFIALMQQASAVLQSIAATQGEEN